MLRTLVSLVAVLALVGAPAALSAQDLGPRGETHAAIDSDGLTVPTTSGPGTAQSTACELASCGEGHAAIDPDGVTAKSTPEAPIPTLLAWLHALLTV